MSPRLPPLAVAVLLFVASSGDAAITGGAGKGYGHNGSINGYHTQAFHFRDSKTTIVSIVNQDGADPNDVTVAALTTLFP